MPLLRTKREYFEWVKSGVKTIDLRRGKPKGGDVAVFLCGREVLRKKILSKKTGKLEEVLTEENYRQIVPDSKSVAEALERIRLLYGATDGEFTTYQVG
jgi:ASC-1-like (ASCH) protein